MSKLKNGFHSYTRRRNFHGHGKAKTEPLPNANARTQAGNEDVHSSYASNLDAVRKQRMGRFQNN